jgi:hypothetical protein
MFPDAQIARSQLESAAQTIGTYLEGGKLAEGDIKKYRKILPQITDTDYVARGKIAKLRELIERKQQEDARVLSASGYNASAIQSTNKTQAIAKKIASQLNDDNYTAESVQEDIQTLLSLPDANETDILAALQEALNEGADVKTVINYIYKQLQ